LIKDTATDLAKKAASSCLSSAQSSEVFLEKLNIKPLRRRRVFKKFKKRSGIKADILRKYSKLNLSRGVTKKKTTIGKCIRYLMIDYALDYNSVFFFYSKMCHGKSKQCSLIVKKV
jgi:hypothetical protein